MDWCSGVMGVDGLYLCVFICNLDSQRVHIGSAVDGVMGNGEDAFKRTSGFEILLNWNYLMSVRRWP